MVPWCSGYHTRLSREGSRVQFPSEPPFGFIAQSVEHKTENLGVVGSIPTETTMTFVKTIFMGFLFFLHFSELFYVLKDYTINKIIKDSVYIYHNKKKY